MHLRKETCYECEKHLRYMESSPAKQMGVTMHMGERFCTGDKRARKFKRNDPKIYVPSWCPERATERAAGLLLQEHDRLDAAREALL